MASYTEHYGLHQWEAADNFLRTDFNTDFGIIDGALGDKAEMAEGSYVGDGTASRDIGLPFAPKAVLVESIYGTRAHNGVERYGGLVLQGDSSSHLKLQSNVLTVYNSNSELTNQASHSYRYLAFR